MEYSVAFAVSAQSYPAPTAPLIVLGLVALGLGGLAIWLRFGKRNSRFVTRVRFYSVGIAVGLCVILLVMKSVKSNHDYLIESANSGKVQIVEGIVEDFHAMPITGHDTERFSVAGRKFEYSDYEVTGGFNNSASHGGPIRAGLPVRVTYVQEAGRNVIVKLEIGRT